MFQLLHAKGQGAQCSHARPRDQKQCGRNIYRGINDALASWNLGDWASIEKLDVIPNHMLTIKDFGVLGLPINPKVVGMLLTSGCCEQAPFGRREATLYDKKVRDTAQIDAVSVSFAFDSSGWQRYVAARVDFAKKKLGIPAAVSVEARLYKFLLYPEGGHFEMHRDTEKEDGMFATLALVMPCSFAGGDLVVTHEGKEMRFRPALSSSGLGGCCMVFYADCRHKIEKITNGCRVALIYNLIYTGASKGLCPTPPGMGVPTATSLVEALKRWQNGAKPNADWKFLYLLQHKYSQRGRNTVGLKRVDAAVQELLRTVITNADLPIGLEVVNVSSSASRFYDPDFVESMDEQATLSSERFGEEEFVAEEILQDVDDVHDLGYQGEIEEATGNEGGTAEQEYEGTALMLYPSGVTAMFERIVAREDTAAIPQKLVDWVCDELAPDVMQILEKVCTEKGGTSSVGEGVEIKVCAEEQRTGMRVAEDRDDDAGSPKQETESHVAKKEKLVANFTVALQNATHWLVDSTGVAAIPAQYVALLLRLRSLSSPQLTTVAETCLRKLFLGRGRTRRLSTFYTDLDGLRFTSPSFSSVPRDAVTWLQSDILSTLQSLWSQVLSGQKILPSKAPAAGAAGAESASTGKNAVYHITAADVLYYLRLSALALDSDRAAVDAVVSAKTAADFLGRGDWSFNAGEAAVGIEPLANVAVDLLQNMEKQEELRPGRHVLLAAFCGHEPKIPCIVAPGIRSRFLSAFFKNGGSKMLEVSAVAPCLVNATIGEIQTHGTFTGRDVTNLEEGIDAVMSARFGGSASAQLSLSSLPFQVAVSEGAHAEEDMESFWCDSDVCCGEQIDFDSEGEDEEDDGSSESGSGVDDESDQEMGNAQVAGEEEVVLPDNAVDGETDDLRSLFADEADDVGSSKLGAGTAAGKEGSGSELRRQKRFEARQLRRSWQCEWQRDHAMICGFRLVQDAYDGVIYYIDSTMYDDVELVVPDMDDVADHLMDDSICVTLQACDGNATAARKKKDKLLVRNAKAEEISWPHNWNCSQKTDGVAHALYLDKERKMSESQVQDIRENLVKIGLSFNETARLMVDSAGSGIPRKVRRLVPVADISYAVDAWDDSDSSDSDERHNKDPAVDHVITRDLAQVKRVAASLSKSSFSFLPSASSTSTFVTSDKHVGLPQSAFLDSNRRYPVFDSQGKVSLSQLLHIHSQLLASMEVMFTVNWRRRAAKLKALAKDCQPPAQDAEAEDFADACVTNAGVRDHQPAISSSSAEPDLSLAGDIAVRCGEDEEDEKAGSALARTEDFFCMQKSTVLLWKAMELGVIDVENIFSGRIREEQTQAAAEAIEFSTKVSVDFLQKLFRILFGDVEGGGDGEAGASNISWDISAVAGVWRVVGELLSERCSVGVGAGETIEDTNEEGEKCAATTKGKDRKGPGLELIPLPELSDGGEEAVAETLNDMLKLKKMLFSAVTKEPARPPTARSRQAQPQPGVTNTAEIQKVGASICRVLGLLCRSKARRPEALDVVLGFLGTTSGFLEAASSPYRVSDSVPVQAQCETRVALGESFAKNFINCDEGGVVDDYVRRAFGAQHLKNLAELLWVHTWAGEGIGARLLSSLNFLDITTLTEVQDSGGFVPLFEIFEKLDTKEQRRKTQAVGGGPRGYFGGSYGADKPVAADHYLQADRFANFMLSTPTTLLPFFQPPLKKLIADYDIVVSDLVEKKQAEQMRTQLPEEAAKMSSYCRCADCSQVARFLGGPETVFRLAVNKKRRGHVHSRIESSRVNVTHVTERIGSPEPLIITKLFGNRKQFDQHVKQSQEILCRLRALVKDSARHADQDECPEAKRRRLD